MSLVYALRTAAVGDGAGGTVSVVKGSPWDSEDDVVVAYPDLFEEAPAPSGLYYARTTAAVRDGLGGTTTVIGGRGYPSDAAVVTANPSLFVEDSDIVFCRYTAAVGNGAGGSTMVFAGQPFAPDDAIVTALPDLFVAASSGGGGVTAFDLLSATKATGGTSFVTSTVAPTANRLVLLFVHTVSVNSASFSVGGAGMTWTSVGQFRYDDTSAFGSVGLFRALSASPGSGALTIFAQATMQTWAVRVVEFAGVNTGGTNGAGAINPAAFGSDGANSATSGSVTMGAFASASNPTVLFIGHQAGETVSSSNMTRVGSDAVNVTNQVQAAACFFNSGNVATPAVSWATSSPWGAYAVELNAA